MVQTRRQAAAASNEGSTPSGDSTAKAPKQAPAKKRGASGSKAQQHSPAKKRKSSPRPSKDEAGETQAAEGQQTLPRLTTPDLEFDWDRSRLKDPRPTPGQERRPRPSWFPTYDCAGFRLNYSKVMDWFKQVPYNKNRMLKGMEKAVAESKSLDEYAVQAFFEDLGEDEEKMSRSGPFEHGLIIDTISKDFGIPHHKIDHAEIGRWEQRDFKKHKVEDWMTYSDEDKKRVMKMMSGSILRA